MPVITFDNEHRDEGFMFLARRGEVGCLPDDVFVVTDVLFELLQKSLIPFNKITNHRVIPEGGAGAREETRQEANRKVPV